MAFTYGDETNRTAKCTQENIDSLHQNIREGHQGKGGHFRQRII